MKETKNRFLFIDLVRVIAIIFVILHHLHFHFIQSNLFESSTLWNNNILNASLGDIGVSLFIFISGLSLTLSLKDREINIKDYIKKRISRIYPDFLVAYLFFFCWFSYKNYLPREIKIPNFILSLTGLDTYLISFFKFSFYSPFDWFIGFIIILYLIFPLLYNLYRRNQYVLILLTSFLVLLTISLSNNYFNPRIITLRLLEFSLGMCYIKTLLSKNIKTHIYILGFSLIALFSFYNIPNPIFYIYRLILLDYVIVEISFLISIFFKKFLIFSKLITFLASISYMVFLLQHQTIIRIMGDLFLPKKVFAHTSFISPLFFQSIFIILIIVTLAILLSWIQKATLYIIRLIFANTNFIKNKKYLN